MRADESGPAGEQGRRRADRCYANQERVAPKIS
jgi:hypothetical protein